MAGRPAETVDRIAYALCVLEQFHRHLKHRNIFVEALDTAYREVAARLDGVTPATVDDGKLHAAALTAVPDPPSLTDLRRRVEAMLPRIDLPELVLAR
ncbi:hypothetical protein [Nocardia brasiliensis]|uniref:hypothetical protein n=1 Tax=Nocardia brasiliensis TaxID=37326 RepID=UPI0024564FBE|nr:hypothetical protein [Nocardia brasiliensis]